MAPTWNLIADVCSSIVIFLLPDILFDKNNGDDDKNCEDASLEWVVSYMLSCEP